MVVLNKIYTRTGDDGTTALGTGQRVSKYSLRIATFGSVDETNSVIGLAISQLDPNNKDHVQVGEILKLVQNDLFDLGADLCTPEGEKKPDYEPLRITNEQVDRLEQEIDSLNQHLDPLRSFVLPGGSPAAASLHIARTVSRRTERAMVELSDSKGEIVNQSALQYINRLSDLLFVASRYVNSRGQEDILWRPGLNQQAENNKD